MIYFNSYKNQFESNNVNISVEKHSYDSVSDERIKTVINHNQIFRLSNYPYFCGGIFLSGIVLPYGMRGDALDPFVSFIKNVFYYLYTNGTGYVGYFTNTGQPVPISVLIKLGFEQSKSFINPNTGNECFHWNLTLTEEYFKEKK